MATAKETTPTSTSKESNEKAAGDMDEELAGLTSQFRGQCKVIDTTVRFVKTVKLHPENLDIVFNFKLLDSYPSSTPVIEIRSQSLDDDDMFDLYGFMTQTAESMAPVSLQGLLEVALEWLHEGNISVKVAASADYCLVSDGIEYCDYGCCDDSCCGMSTETIVGFAIGGVMLLVTIIGCIVCAVLMCKKSNRHGSVQPIHHNTNSVYVNNAHGGYHPPPRQPPSYDQHNSYPSGSYNPAYNSYNDSVYPPGVVNSHPPPAYTYSEPSSRK